MGWTSLDDHDFDAKLDAHQARLADEADAARRRSWLVARRPDAVPVVVRFDELRVGDYITADGVRWSEVVELRGPICNVKSRQQVVDDGNVSVTFEIPEPITVNLETRWVIDRPFGEPVRIDASVRNGVAGAQERSGRDDKPNPPGNVTEPDIDRRAPDSASGDHPCPLGDGCALNDGAIHCFACGRNWPPDETWQR